MGLMLEWLFGQAHRFMYWTGQNSAAIQALSSVVTVFLTALLAGVTYWYVHLTNRLARTAQIQLESLLQPDVEFEINLAMTTSEGNFSIKNKTAAPIKIL